MNTVQSQTSPIDEQPLPIATYATPPSVRRMLLGTSALGVTVIVGISIYMVLNGKMKPDDILPMSLIFLLQ